ncbi:glycoside hydrolase family 32 protein [Brenneria goodwinii]|uniref:beta-fructofuranosidase n=1 Tax=Brenneria goodwinii TaxID=1109412 RepID=A0A0G4K0I9_9GAMM|nr:glycoside hydrolase family 32 protein [Brenneria goodwinii]CPR19839.1 Sucrose-6-phosphate hydrolase (EC 3.2.1.B3) [Brenneria goodwinii]
MFGTNKITTAILLVLMTSLNTACSASASSDSQDQAAKGTHVEVHQAVNAFFPRVPGSYIGDPMPYAENNQFYIFHLNDIRGGKDLGVHAFHLLSTNNLYNYQNLGEVIPYVNDLDSPELLLGTGSIIKAGATYHAWYTAHNQNVFPVESIMHATSSDMRNWTKHPKDTFLPGKDYRGNDFRDPHVVYIPEEQRYWMLITTRQNGTGVIVKYTSTDLANWKDEGVLFRNDTPSYDANLECPTLVYFNGRWYLSFSDQWPHRLTQYRMAESPNGPFVKPANFYFDGAGLYAGKLVEKDQRLFVFGWVPTKAGEENTGNIDWAGNLIAHELTADAGGQLRTRLPREITDVFAQKAPQASQLRPLLNENSAASFGEIGSQVFAPLTGTTEISGNLPIHGDGAIFSFGMDDDIPQNAPLNIVFNKKTNKVLFYTAGINELPKRKPEMGIETPLSDNINLKVIIEDSIAVFYINDNIAFSTRMYHISGKKWAISAPQSNIDTSDLRIRHF